MDHPRVVAAVCLAFLASLIVGPCWAQSEEIKGQIVIHNSGVETGRMIGVRNASIRAPKAKAVTSDGQGRFVLHVVGVEAGVAVPLTVSSAGLVPLDPTSLLRTVVGMERPLRVVMTDPDRLAAAQLEFFQVAGAEIDKAHERQLQQLRDDQRSVAERLIVFEQAGHHAMEDLAEALEVLGAERDAAYDRAQELAQRFAQADLDVASDRFRQAIALFRAGRVAETMALLDTAALATALHGALDSKRNGELLIARADSAIIDVIEALGLRADVLQATLRYKDALVAIERCTTICSEQPGLCDGRRRMELAMERSFVQRLLGRFDLGLLAIDAALTEARGIPNITPDELVTLKTGRADLLRERGEYQLAMEQVKEAVADAYSADPSQPGTLMIAQFAYAQALSDLGSYDEVIEQGMATVRAASDPVHPDARYQARGWMVVSQAYAQKGMLDSALIIGQRGLDIFSTTERAGSPELVNVLNNVALYLADLGRTEEALELLEEARRQQRLSSPEDHPSVAVIDLNIAACWKDLEQWDKASDLLLKVIARMRALLGSQHPKLWQALVQLGGVYIRADRTQEAISTLTEALSIATSALGPVHPSLMNIQNSIGKAYLWSAQPDSALVHYERALAVVRANDSLPNADEALVRMNLARTYTEMGRDREALAQARSSVHAYSLSFGEDHPEMAMARTVLGIALFNTNEFAEADQELAKSLAIRPGDRANWYRYRIAKRNGQDDLALSYLIASARLLPSDPAHRNTIAQETMRELKAEADRLGRAEVLQEFKFE